MRTENLNSWEEFEKATNSFLSELNKIKNKKELHVSVPLFRGHVEASWKLETTLDRITENEFKMRDYYSIIRSVHPAIVSITGKEWDLPNYLNENESKPLPPDGYEFMIYLRHHGFPSPLLDWSRSPYVAAFFAFRSSGDPQNENVAIYSYVEYVGQAKSWSGGDPTMFGLGPYVISHRRHYAQQCEYTICKKDVHDGHVYSKHEDAISQKVAGQDQLVKYILPKSERPKVLGKLELMNITAFSLFGSEESLMDTMAYQEIEKKLLF